MERVRNEGKKQEKGTIYEIICLGKGRREERMEGGTRGRRRI